VFVFFSPAAAMTRKERIKAIASTYYGRNRNVWKRQLTAVYRGLDRQFKDRRKKGRMMRALWMQQINGAVKEQGLSYATFMNSLALDGILLNRKMLSALAQDEPLSFRALIEQVRDRLIERRKEDISYAIANLRQRREREDLEREWVLQKDRTKKLDIEALIVQREKEITDRAAAYPAAAPAAPTAAPGRPRRKGTFTLPRWKAAEEVKLRRVRDAM